MNRTWTGFHGRGMNARTRREQTASTTYVRRMPNGLHRAVYRARGATPRTAATLFIRRTVPLSRSRLRCHTAAFILSWCHSCLPTSRRSRGLPPHHAPPPPAGLRATAPYLSMPSCCDLSHRHILVRDVLTLGVRCSHSLFCYSPNASHPPSTNSSAPTGTAAHGRLPHRYRFHPMAVTSRATAFPYYLAFTCLLRAYLPMRIACAF